MHLPGRSILIVAAGLLFSSLVLGALGVFALPSAVSDFLADLTGIRQSTMRALHTDENVKPLRRILLPRTRSTP